MRGVVAMTAVLLAGVLFSGCFVEEDASGTQSEDASSSDAASSRTGTGSGPGTQAPSANATGSAPSITDFVANATALDVAFTISATDADNGTLTWTLAFGDNATANGTFPVAPAGGGGNASANQTAGTRLANATHAYAAAGTYNVTLTVSDGGHAVNRTLAVTVTGGAPPSAPMAPMSFSGSCTTGVAPSVTHKFTVTPGQPLIHATITIGGGGVDLDWFLNDPSGGEADASESGAVRSEGPLDATSPVPGDWSIRVLCYAGVAASYSIQVAFA